MKIAARATCSSTHGTNGVAATVSCPAVLRAFDPSSFDPDAFDTTSAGMAAFVRGVVDDDAAAIATPQAIDRMEAGVRILMYKDGVFEAYLHPYVLSWSMTESIGEVGPTGTMTLAVPRDGCPWGNPLRSRVPSPGLRDISIWLKYRRGGKEYARAFTLGGYVDSQRRTVDGIVSDVLTIHGQWARFARGPITFTRPPGHSAYHGEILHALMGTVATAHNPANGPQLDWYWPQRLPGDVPMTKPIHIDDEEWVSFARDIAEVFGGMLYQSNQTDGGHPVAGVVDLESGNATAGAEWRIAFDRPEAGIPAVKGIIDESVILRSVNGQRLTVQVEPNPNPPAAMCVEGTEQLVRETCGHTVRVLPSRNIITNYTFEAMPYKQDGTGTVTASGITGGTVASQVVSQAETTIEKECETLVSLVSEQWALRNPLAARYTLATDLTVNGYLPCYLEGNDDGDNARQFAVERPLQQGKTVTTYEFKANKLSRQTVETFAPHIKRAYLQSRAARSVAWDDLVSASGLTGRLALGNGEGVAEAIETVRLTRRQTIDFEDDGEGYIARKVTRTYEWSLRQGWQYLYGDGTESADSEESFQLTEEIEETFRKVDEETYYYTRTTFRPLQVKNRETFFDEFRDGTIPPIDKRTDVAPVRSEFDSQDEFEQARAAVTTDQQAFIYSAVNGYIERVRAPQPRQIVTHQWLPNANVAKSWLDRQILRGESLQLSFATLPWKGIHAGDWWRLRYRLPGLELDAPALIQSITVGQSGPGEVPIYNITARVYP